MGLWLPANPSALVPAHTAVVRPQAPAAVQPEAVSMPAQPLSDSTADALRQTDENLKKRIIALAS